MAVSEVLAGLLPGLLCECVCVSLEPVDECHRIIVPQEEGWQG